MYKAQSTHEAPTIRARFTQRMGNQASPIELTLAVSMDNVSETKESFGAFIDLINRHNKTAGRIGKLKVLLSCWLQRHYVGDKEAQRMGDAWIETNIHELEKLISNVFPVVPQMPPISYEIIRWKQITESAEYQSNHQKIIALYEGYSLCLMSPEETSPTESSKCVINLKAQDNKVMAFHPNTHEKIELQLTPIDLEGLNFPGSGEQFKIIKCVDNTALIDKITLQCGLALYGHDEGFRTTVAGLAKRHAAKGSDEQARDYLLEECAVFATLKGAHIAYPSNSLNAAIIYINERFDLALHYHGYALYQPKKNDLAALKEAKAPYSSENNKLGRYPVNEEETLLNNVFKFSELLDRFGIRGEQQQSGFFQDFLKLKKQYTEMQYTDSGQGVNHATDENAIRLNQFSTK